MAQQLIDAIELGVERGISSERVVYSSLLQGERRVQPGKLVEEMRLGHPDPSCC